MENQGSDRHDPITPTPAGQENSSPVPPSPGEDAAEEQHRAPWLRRNGPFLILTAAVLAFLAIKFNPLVILVVGVGLGLVIFIHELGHFLVAKWCDVHVQTFSIGFGPALPGCQFRWGETTYMIGLLPLGGYVKMVGEGPESEEEEDDPRSFKNKPVWQRMAIISAGVTMNLLMGCVCFVIAYLHGVKQEPGVVGMVDIGSPAWERDLRSGLVIDRIGNVQKPYFSELQPEVMLSRKGQKLLLVAKEPGGKTLVTDVEPRRTENEMRPVIGVSPPRELNLWSKEDLLKERESPVFYDSAAEKAEPPFEFGDAIVATTDPDHPDQVKDLDLDPRNPENPQRHAYDYFEFRMRMKRLAGQPVTVRVRREGADAPVDIHVPPAYHYVFSGVRMRMGKVAAVRDNSSGKEAGVAEGDIITQVKVRGAATRVFKQEDLDPNRLPYDLEHFPADAAGKKFVTLTVLRPNEHAGEEKVSIDLKEVEWDSRREFDLEWPANPSSPQDLCGLGVAYQIETIVVDVKPDSPAARAGLQKDDIITEVRFKEAGLKKGEWDWGEWNKLWSKREDGEVYEPWWAFFTWILQFEDFKQIQVKVKRGKDVLPEPITLEAEPDKDWPLEDRGLLLKNDWRIQKAGNFGEALGMGLRETIGFTKQVFGNLVSILTFRISPRLLGGPITIARAAYQTASTDFFKFLLFLGIISVNLAVINFLPIPVLDGGHMVFLAYEKLRGKPASDQVRAAATYVGLALILCLMAFVLYLDVTHL